MALSEEGIVQVPGVSSHWVRLPTGAKSHYMYAGESGPAVILLHGGLGGSSGMAGWRFMLPFLGANGFRVFAPDRPGYGLADAREEHWPKLGYKSQVDWLRDFADTLCIDKFHISGNSQGSLHAALFMLNHPERILSAALVATASLPAMTGVDPSLLVQQSPRFVYPPYEGTKESMLVMMKGIIYKESAIDDEFLEMRTRDASAQVESRAAFQQANDSQDPGFLQWMDTRERLTKLAFPMIYLHGLQDATVVIDNIVQAEKLLPNIQFFYPDQCGHQGQTDQPEMFNQVFLEFFRDGRVSRATAEWANVSRTRPEIAEFVEQQVPV